jgi:molybdopterin adenylyltransferase
MREQTTVITKILIIALNDTFETSYVDKHGQILKDLINKELTTPEITNEVIDADLTKLKTRLQQGIEKQIDVVFTIGGTGLGIYDIAPEAASAVCEKFIPGLIDFIRIKYGAQKPKALLSRSVAGIAKATQIYALPGSSRALQEYFSEIALLWQDIASSLQNFKN